MLLGCIVAGLLSTAASSMTIEHRYRDETPKASVVKVGMSFTVATAVTNLKAAREDSVASVRRFYAIPAIAYVERTDSRTTNAALAKSAEPWHRQRALRRQDALA
jgi:hypothetical protein